MRGGGPYWGPRKPGGPIPPRHSGKACGSGDVRAVHPEAAWLSGQAWDARGPRWAGEASRALDTENTERHCMQHRPKDAHCPPPRQASPPPSGLRWCLGTSGQRPPRPRVTHAEALQVTTKPGPLHVDEGLRGEAESPEAQTAHLRSAGETAPPRRAPPRAPALGANCAGLSQ